MTQNSQQVRTRSSVSLSGLSFAALILISIFIGLIGWTLYGIGILKTEPAADWMTFYTASRLYFDGQLAFLYDGAHITNIENAAFAKLLAHPFTFEPWVYPPSFLVLLLPFGLLPFWTSYAVFLILSLLCLFAGVRAYAIRPGDRWFLYSSLALCPAMAPEIFFGQNGLLICALLLGGFAALPCRPVLAGVLLGLLSFKPQFGILIPVALIAGRHFKAFASAAILVCALAAISLILFGVECWVQWLEFAIGKGQLYHSWAIENRTKGESIFSAAVAFGMPTYIAETIQKIFILVISYLLYSIFKSNIDNYIKFSIFMISIIISSPHVMSYDMLLLALSASFMMIYIERNKCALWANIPCFFLWWVSIIPLTRNTYVPTIIILISYVIFIVISSKAKSDFSIFHTSRASASVRRLDH